MEKFLYYNDLFSIYGKLLTLNEQKTFSLYYEENLSMGEIANNEGISRSAVGYTVKKVTKKLDKYESILNIYAKTKQIKEIVNDCHDEELKGKIENILNH